MLSDVERSSSSDSFRRAWLTLALQGCSICIDISSSGGGSSVIDVAAVRSRLTRSLTKSESILCLLQVTLACLLPLAATLSRSTGQTERRFFSKCSRGCC